MYIVAMLAHFYQLGIVRIQPEILIMLQAFIAHKCMVYHAAVVPGVHCIHPPPLPPPPDSMCSVCVLYVKCHCITLQA